MNEQEIKDYIDEQLGQLLQRVVVEFLRPRLAELLAEFRSANHEMLGEVRAMTDVLAERLDLLGAETSSTSMSMTELAEMVYSFKQEIDAARQELNEIRDLLERRPGNDRPMLLH
ncbi:MAG: hypothetical protein DLM69_09060 [Candidatus Chloroheliales bacterium]|nr:MAG: hypothetical protein DLM69_09060 [Chloroflexota bacterium]